MFTKEFFEETLCKAAPIRKSHSGTKVWGKNTQGKAWLGNNWGEEAGTCTVVCVRALARVPFTATLFSAERSRKSTRLSNINSIRHELLSHARCSLRACKFSANFAALLALTTRVWLQQALQLCYFHHHDMLTTLHNHESCIGIALCEHVR